VEESVANGESFVIKRDGEIKEVPAKDLLKTLSKEICKIERHVVICIEYRSL